MSDRCQSDACPGGNCPGCRNGAVFCEDPRCYPDCQGCDTKPPGQNNAWLTTLILIGLGLLLVLALVVGFGWFNDRKKAAEPKQLTVNKHIHTVTPPSIVVTSPTPQVQTASRAINATATNYGSVPATSMGNLYGNTSNPLINSSFNV